MKWKKGVAKYLATNNIHQVSYIVQSEFEPDILDTRIEAFIESLEEALEQMSELELNSHIEALATKRLEKPKQLTARNGRYWSERSRWPC